MNSRASTASDAPLRGVSARMHSVRATSARGSPTRALDQSRTALTLSPIGKGVHGAVVEVDQHLPLEAEAVEFGSQGRGSSGCDQSIQLCLGLRSAVGSRSGGIFRACSWACARAEAFAQRDGPPRPPLHRSGEGVAFDPVDQQGRPAPPVPRRTHAGHREPRGCREAASAAPPWWRCPAARS